MHNARAYFFMSIIMTLVDGTDIAKALNLCNYPAQRTKLSFIFSLVTAGKVMDLFISNESIPKDKLKGEKVTENFIAWQYYK